MGNDLVRILSENGNQVYVTSRRRRQSQYPNVVYIQGDGKEDAFLRQLIKKNRYDAIVDFMSYSTDAFQKRIRLLLEATNQYIFFSSGRVFADSKELITEESNRLLDVCGDSEYLKTDEYALAKARQEDILKDSEKRNWTIIRPYVTYSNIRLQLGFQEKELWLYRVLHGRTLVFGNDIAEKYTTLTFGGDVAEALIRIIGNVDALGNVYNITQPNFIQWKDIMELYLETIEEVKGVRPKVIMEEDSCKLAIVAGRQMQRKFDRLYDRKFNNTKVSALYPSIKNGVSTENGLKACLKEFLVDEPEFGNMNWKAEGYMDKVAKEFTPLKEIPGMKNKLKYILARHTSYFENRE